MSIVNNNLPTHIAIIMDGNGRWATNKNLPRLMGHKAGVDATERVVTHLAEIGVQYATLYTFSTENWNRPQEEVEGLFKLLIKSIGIQSKKLNENNIKLIHTGRRSNFSKEVNDALDEAIELTKNNTHLTLSLALDYGGQQEIVDACRKIVHDGIKAENINEKLFSNYLYSPDIPPVDLIIRSAGEKRISNFLLWESAYAEYYFSNTLWPDFTGEEIDKAIEDYSNRKRKFGKVL